MKGRNPVRYLFGQVWKHAEENRKNIVLYWILFIIANVTVLLIHPFVMARLMNSVQENGVTEANIRFLFLYLGISIFSNLFFWAFHGPARVLERANAYIAEVNLRKFLLKGIMTLPLDWHAEHHSGESIDKIEKGTKALFTFSSQSFAIIMFAVRLVVCYCMLVFLSWPSAIIVVVMTCLAVWITMRFDKVIIGNYKHISKIENNISASVFDTVSNISTVVILRVEKVIFETISKKLWSHRDVYEKNIRAIEMKWFLVSMVTSLMTAIVLGTYFWQHLGTSKTVLVGSVFLLVRYLDEMSELFFRFADMYSDVLAEEAKLANSEELSKDFRDESFANHVLPTDWSRIEVKNLCFSYPGSADRLHLDNVSFEIIRGKSIALVGPSGSGKTTLLKVLRDLHHPKSLELSVNGQVVSDGFPGISRDIALVPQSPEIFATTIGANITLGADYDPLVVRRHTDLACFSDVVDRLPKGLESTINEKGVNLSGGERQRLALARGLLACHGKSIILLDEPTSSVDSTNELKIYGNIFREFKGTSKISSIHRLHLLRFFDIVHLFDKGRIVASGTFEELLTSSPEFQELWRNYNDAQKEE